LPEFAVWLHQKAMDMQILTWKAIASQEIVFSSRLQDYQYCNQLAQDNLLPERFQITSLSTTNFQQKRNLIV
jgi:hypothetical protein